jgi:hypothetical protein
LSLSSIKRYNMKAFVEMEVWVHRFLTSKLGGGECPASHLDRFILARVSGSSKTGLVLLGPGTKFYVLVIF